MTRVQIDDKICEVASHPDIKVRDVLKDVVTMLPPNRIVTKVSLNGQRYTNIGEDPMLDKPIDVVNDLEVKTADKSIWAITGLDISLSCIERVQRSLIRTAELFREENTASGHRLFLQCIEGIEKFIESITITRTAMNLNFDKISFDGYTLTQAESALNQILKVMLDCQTHQNYGALADKIEYELLTNLVTWKSALNQFRNSQNSNA